MLGDPIAHSLSPVLHRAGYAATGLAWEYDAHRVAAGGLAGFVAGLDEDWRGLSLTMPLKREALGLVDDLSDTARLAGAANTLVLGDRLVGDNTDVPGVAAALSEHGVSAVRSATILGGGATATSVGLALADRGAEVLTLLVRDIDRAGGDGHPAAPPPVGAPTVQVLPLGGWEATGDVVVSTIPAVGPGRRPGRPVRRRARSVFDVVYDPWPTPLAVAAAARGQVLVSGLDLLVHQAALQFALFTGLPAPVAGMRAAGERALSDRDA